MIPITININSQQEYRTFIKDIAAELSKAIKPEQHTISKRKIMKELHVCLSKVNTLIENGTLKLDPFGQILFQSFDEYKANKGEF